MTGIIRNNRNYSDGKPSFEIDLYQNTFPVIHKKRVVCNLKINDKTYLAGVRHLTHTGPWISPYLNDLKSGEKLRLSEILIKNGFRKNEHINLNYEKASNTLIIQKISTKADLI